MGLNRHSLNVLIELKNLTGFDVDFNSILTIGRQGIHENSKYLDKFLKKKKLNFTMEEFELILDSDEGYSYCENFFKNLGSKIVDSIDYSDFEGCSIVHDMNKEIDSSYHNKYDIVLDGGSLEHIFNFTTSISNCMKLVKEGGYFIGIFPTDNHSNHGFYQFSPELFFRCFSRSNGFEKGKLFIYQETKKLNLYEMKDPDILSRRLQFNTLNPTVCFFISKKIENKDLFQEQVNQSDYTKKWNSDKLTNSKNNLSKSINGIKKLLHPTLKQLLKHYYNIFKHYYNKFLLINTGYGLLDKEGFKKIR